mmetsp:Transcript_78515/g.157026  ORF Transcript_78515/g.157026 Transcript_78515/m.157026 type:complete len:182 (-) Transcript_78515:104-649(-)|eukprot:CAMPEP_0171632088 /NCGR_PEP_ID=MMETSP0990-20121206/24144_1 /TAXON_ID=483369 /ORGANISM="non described non described, Strain CCMP2098" /LENGTH=181 /DNA_ID=CAMNT_0012202037 /DNA_START=41 /DNA_END=586 /DNA_ORIENTATION=+
MMKIILALAVLVSSAAAFAPRLRQRMDIRMGLTVGEQFPAPALKKWGLSGKPSVIYFYGADESPSCTKQAQAFDELFDDFKGLGCNVCGVRNEKGVKGDFENSYGQKFVVDDEDEVRTEIGISKDLFGLLGGRETYVVDGKGTVTFVFNDQFKADAHAPKALSAARELPTKKAGFEFKFPF